MATSETIESRIGFLAAVSGVREGTGPPDERIGRWKDADVLAHVRDHAIPATFTRLLPNGSVRILAHVPAPTHPTAAVAVYFLPPSPGAAPARIHVLPAGWEDMPADKSPHAARKPAWRDASQELAPEMRHSSPPSATSAARVRGMTRSCEDCGCGCPPGSCDCGCC